MVNKEITRVYIIEFQDWGKGAFQPFLKQFHLTIKDAEEFMGILKEMHPQDEWRIMFYDVARS